MRLLRDEWNLPYNDFSTAVLYDNGQVYTHSSSILRLLPCVGLPWSVLGPVLLCIPRFVRDFGYGLFARHRGNIWRGVKRVTRMGDTDLSAHRRCIVGLEGEDEIPPSWGLGNVVEESKKEN